MLHSAHRINYFITIIVKNKTKFNKTLFLIKFNSILIYMKSLSEYIFEKIKNLPKNVSGIIVFDIDDTILKVDSSLMSIYKKTENVFRQ